MERETRGAPDPGTAAPVVAGQLSAWLDGELPAAEMDVLAARLRRDGASDAAARLARYALIGAVVRQQPGALRAHGLAPRVAGALAADARLAADPGAAAHRRWPWPAAGLAASLLVALVAVLAFAPGPGSQPGPRVVAAAESSGLRSSATALPADQLTNYLVYHGEYSGTLAGKLVDSHIVGHHPALAAAALP